MINKNDRLKAGLQPLLAKTLENALAYMSWHAVQVEKFSSNLCEVPDHKRIGTYLL
jgi:hypothetical protein